MAVLPASKAYPRGGAPRRQYVKGAPLFARMALKFCGVDYPRGAELPVDQMSPHKHWELWMCGKADHVLVGPFDRKSAPVEAPAIVEAAAVSEAIEVAVESVAAVESSAVEPMVTPLEAVEVPPPAPREPSRKKR